MFKPKKTEHPPLKDNSLPNTETGKSQAPPPFQLAASPDQPVQMFAGPLSDALSRGWDMLTGGDKDEKEAAGNEQQNEQATPEIEAPQAVIPPAGVFEVTDPKSYIRKGPPEFKSMWPKKLIPQGSQVRVVESMTVSGKQYSRVVQEMGDAIGPPMDYGWTSHANLALSSPPTKEEQEAAEAHFESQKKVQEEKAASGDYDSAEEQQYEFTEVHSHYKDKDTEWSGSDYNNFLLEKAELDPDTFWSEFTDTELFGVSAQSLHKDFANLLKNVERLTVQKVVASEDFKAWQESTKRKGTDAATVGKFLGISYYSTIRPEDKDSTSSSFHMYGMAIDFNANNNPWISDSSGTMGVIEEGKLKGVRTKTQQLQDCLDRIGQLTHQSLTFEHVNPDHGKYDMMSMFDNSDKLDKAFELYFSFTGGGNTEELKKLLAASPGGDWAGMSLEDAQKVIEKDFEDMTQLWSRSGQKNTTKKHGIMDLDRRLVQSMNAMGLDWGGKYGDMMHFDMRFLGKGAKIRQAKNSKEGKQKKRDIEKANKEKKEQAKKDKKK